MKKKAIKIGSITLLLSGICATAALAETMDMVASYPGPGGDYDRLHTKRETVGSVYNRTAIKDTPESNIPDGTLLVSSKVGIGIPIGPPGLPPPTPLATLHAVAPGGFGGEDVNGISLVTNVPILSQSDSTAIGILNGDGRQAFALNIDGNVGTNVARGVPTFYDKYDGNWHPGISLKNGNVGIGTADPISKLHISGTVLLENGNQLLQKDSGGTPRNLLTHYTDDNVYLDNPNQNIFLRTGGGLGNVVAMGPSGNVGIGTANPSQKLDVAGDIVANSFAVNNNAFRLLSMMSINNVPAINFKPAGFLGRPDSWVVIGTPGAPVDLFVNGNIAASGIVQWPIGWPSDVRLKKEIEPIQGALEKVLQMRGVTFEWKDPATYGKGPQIGVIAQEVEKVFPQVVSTGPDGFKKVDYPRLAVPLVEAIRELKTENSALETKNTELEARVKVLEEKVNKK